MAEIEQALPIRHVTTETLVWRWAEAATLSELQQFIGDLRDGLNELGAKIERERVRRTATLRAFDESELSMLIIRGADEWPVTLYPGQWLTIWLSDGGIRTVRCMFPQEGEELFGERNPVVMVDESGRTSRAIESGL